MMSALNSDPITLFGPEIHNRVLENSSAARRGERETDQHLRLQTEDHPPNHR